MLPVLELLGAMPPLSCVLALAVAALLATLFLPNAQERAVRHLPTPATALPLLGSTLDFVFAYRDKLYDFYLDETLRQRGAMWRMKVLGRAVAVVLTTPEAFEHVLKTKFEDFGKGDAMHANLADMMGDGIFAVDGPHWAHQRKLASHLFALDVLHDAMESTVVDTTAVLCTQLDAAAQHRRPVDIKRLLDRFTMDVFTKIGFGVDLDSLASTETPPFLDAFDRASRNLLERFRGPAWLWQLKKRLHIGSERALAADIAVLNALAYNIIARSLARHNDPQNTASTTAAPLARDLISLFLDKQEATNASFDNATATFVRDLTVNFVAAGRDTTSQSMAWLLVMLNRYPRVLAAIRLEIAQKLSALATGAMAVPTMQDVVRLTYLEAAIRESLRLNPVVAANSRTALRDTTLHDGTFIKQGTRVTLPIYTLGRLASIWGDDALEYKPERWLDAAIGKLIRVSPFQFAAFLGGPRICIGMTFALVEMKIAMAAVLSTFDLTTVRDPFASTYCPTLTMTIQGPVDVIVTPRVAVSR